MKTSDCVWIALVVALLLQFLVTWPSNPVSWYRKLYGDKSGAPLQGWRNLLAFLVPFALTYLVAFFTIKHLNNGYEVVQIQ